MILALTLVLFGVLIGVVLLMAWLFSRWMTKVFDFDINLNDDEKLW